MLYSKYMFVAAVVTGNQSSGVLALYKQSRSSCSLEADGPILKFPPRPRGLPLVHKYLCFRNGRADVKTLRNDKRWGVVAISTYCRFVSGKVPATEVTRERENAHRNRPIVARLEKRALKPLPAPISRHRSRTFRHRQAPERPLHTQAWCLY